MIYLVHKKQESLCLSPTDGPLAGETVARAEQLQLVSFQFNPKGTRALICGRVVASWGLELSPDADLPYSMVFSLGINRPFRSLTYAKRAAVKVAAGRKFLASPVGAMLNVSGSLCHVFRDHAVYTL